MLLRAAAEPLRNLSAHHRKSKAAVLKPANDESIHIFVHLTSGWCACCRVIVPILRAETLASCSPKKKRHVWFHNYGYPVPKRKNANGNELRSKAAAKSTQNQQQSWKKHLKTKLQTQPGTPRQSWRKIRLGNKTARKLLGKMEPLHNTRVSCKQEGTARSKCLNPRAVFNLSRSSAASCPLWCGQQIISLRQTDYIRPKK